MTTVCLAADTIGYPEGGGHLWAYLNWALGLRANVCDVIWMEHAHSSVSINNVDKLYRSLKERLAPYGFGDLIALCDENGRPVNTTESSLTVEDAAESDVLLNFLYSATGDILRHFGKTVLVDIDPGLLQTWMATGVMRVSDHDYYVTTGEGIGGPAPVPDCGLSWVQAGPCVCLDTWVPSDRAVATSGPFTTVSHWYADEWLELDGEVLCNNKRASFLPFLELPRYTKALLELALCLSPAEGSERERLERLGWRIRDAGPLTSTPWNYQSYIRRSAGEFSSVKPSCLHLPVAWISDRSICYLASGKPVVVQHTGPSRRLPDAAGLYRFHTISQAATYLDWVIDNYQQAAAEARACAEALFDARAVSMKVLELAVP
jgi:hypothetical protein